MKINALTIKDKIIPLFMMLSEYKFLWLIEPKMKGRALSAHQLRR